MRFHIVNNSRFDKNGFCYGEESGKVNTGDAVRCEECGNFLTMLEWLPPFQVKLSKGKLGDVIFGTYSHFIVSEKFKEVYDKNGFKGIRSFEPVALLEKGKPISLRYYYPKIVLSNALVDIEKSGIVFDGDKECSTCQKAGRTIVKMDGLYFSREEAIQDDIFCSKILPGDIVVSNKFKEATSGLLNLSFTDSKDYKPSWVI